MIPEAPPILRLSGWFRLDCWSMEILAIESSWDFTISSFFVIGFNWICNLPFGGCISPLQLHSELLSSGP